jgi:hypothetical protein
MTRLTAPEASLPDALAETVELAGCAYLQYKHALFFEKRELIKKISSKRMLDGKSLTITLESPFHLIANRFAVPCGSPSRTAGRDVGAVWDWLLPQLISALPARSAVRVHALAA